MEVVEVPTRGRKQLVRKSLKRSKPIRRKPGLKRTKGKIKPKGVSKLMKELDAIFSRYVRLKGSNHEGIVECYTCGHHAHYKKMQNGHYISRFYKKYRFDERNTRIQCSMCNLWKSGDIATFRRKLVAELGVEVVESMEADYKELHRLEVGFLEEKIAHYKERVDKLTKEV